MTISLKAFKTLKEARKLFIGYRTTIQTLDTSGIIKEVNSYLEESVRYPHHLLTLVKGELIVNELKSRDMPEFKEFVKTEQARLEQEVNSRLYS